ncbi:unnamed protein product [Lathyrus sativus]|nr:unnamed protein product [Lathyrus sativus]
MSNNNIRNFDLNECSVEDFSVENDYSEVIVEHFDCNIGEKDVLEGDIISSIEKENLVSSNQNVEINEFLEEVDNGGASNETNILPFVGQIFLSEEEAFVFYKRYAYQHGFSIRKGRFIKQNGIISRRDFFCHCEGKVPLKIIEPSKEQRKRETCKAHL